MKALLEVFYRPGKLFESLPERRSAWVVPILFDALLLLAISALVPHFIGRENMMRQQLESMRLTPEQTQKAVESASSPARVYAGYAASTIAAPLILSIVAGMLMIFGMMTSKPSRFRTMFSMVSIAFFPYWLIATLMTALVLMASPDPATLDVRNLVATNVGSFVDKSSMSKGMYSLLSSMDVLSFGEIGLLALGFSKVTKSSIFFGLVAVGSIWALYVAVKMALSLLF